VYGAARGEIELFMIATVHGMTQTWTWVHFYQPSPTEPIKFTPNPTHFMLLADPTQPIKLFLL